MGVPTSPIPEPLGNPICLGPVEVWQIGQDVYGVLAPALSALMDCLPAGLTCAPAPLGIPSRRCGRNSGPLPFIL